MIEFCRTQQRPDVTQWGGNRNGAADSAAVGGMGHTRIPISPNTGLGDIRSALGAWWATHLNRRGGWGPKDARLTQPRTGTTAAAAGAANAVRTIRRTPTSPRTTARGEGGRPRGEGG